jgi:BMFP domain-containing protein YqiC
MESMMKARFERLVSDLDLVQREEFEAVKAMAAKARAENDKLSARVMKIESKLAAQATPARPRIRKPAQAKRSKGNL